MSKGPKHVGNNVIIIAGYQAMEPAKKNFDQLTQLVKEKKVKSEGMILVEQNKDGQVSISETGDHLSRKGMGWGGGVGLLGASSPLRYWPRLLWAPQLVA